MDFLVRAIMLCVLTDRWRTANFNCVEHACKVFRGLPKGTSRRALKVHKQMLSAYNYDFTCFSTDRAMNSSEMLKRVTLNSPPCRTPRKGLYQPALLYSVFMKMNEPLRKCDSSTRLRKTLQAWWDLKQHCINNVWQTNVDIFLIEWLTNNLISFSFVSPASFLLCVYCPHLVSCDISISVQSCFVFVTFPLHMFCCLL